MLSKKNRLKTKKVDNKRQTAKFSLDFKHASFRARFTGLDEIKDEIKKKGTKDPETIQEATRLSNRREQLALKKV